jgi:hypothetical protein
MAAGRRQPPPVPGGAPPPLAHMWKLLLQLWAWAVNSHFGLPAPHADTHIVGGADPLATPGTPDTIGLANAAGTPSAGVGPSYAYEDHDHGDIKRDVRVQKAAADIGTRNALNFIEGAGVTLTVADNGGSDRVDVTVSAAPAMDPGDLELLAWLL